MTGVQTCALPIWHGRQPCEQLAEEPGGLSVPAGDDQDVQDIPVLVERPPPVVGLALDCDEHPVEMPLIARPGPTVT